MSDPNVEECSYLKVDHDFEYTTNDGRRIAIKKDEKLCLIQKTNDDWWKVIRYKEQRSFYVPVTYVTQLHRPFLPKRNLAVKQKDEQIVDETSKDQSARQRQVEKWLSNTMSISQRAAGGPEHIDEYNKLENVQGKEIASRSEQQRRNLEAAEEHGDSGRNKGLERFRNVVRKLSSSKNAGVKGSPTKDSLQTVMENAGVKPSLAINPVISPKKLKEVGQNLFDYQATSQHQIPHASSQNPRPKMMRSNSTDSAESSNDRRSTNSDSVSAKIDPKAAFNEELSISLQKNNAIKRYSNSSNDRRLVKPNIEKRPDSPMSTGKKTPTSSVSASPQSPNTFNYPDNAMKILNDKRKSWAVEELMSELTQIRKDRVDDNTSNFVLRSVAIRDRFDPHEILTQELHDLHTSQQEDSVTLRSESKSQDDDAGGRKKSEEPSPSKAKETAGVSPKSMKLLPLTMHQQQADESASDKSYSPKTRISLTDNEACSIQASKSSKRLDEYEEANILNDESRMQTDARHEGSDRKVSLSSDKERYLSAYQEHSQLFKSDIDHTENFEKPSYSNISVKLESEVKTRPELKLKINSADNKIKLTPSLEKLASEIQFLPASRTSAIDNEKQQSPLTKNRSLPRADSDQKNSLNLKDSSFDGDDDDDDEDEDGNDPINVAQGREMWKNFKSKLNHKNSLKSKQEEKNESGTKDVSLEEDRLQDFARPVKTKLKKSATFNCVAVPEYYKHFQRHHDSRREFLRKANRRSRSLEDIRLLVTMELNATLAAKRRSEAVKKMSGNLKPDSNVGKSAAKPIPAPRAVDSARVAQAKAEEGLAGSYKGAKTYFPVLPPSTSKSYENLSQDFTNLKVFDTNKSTAVSFKNLLCNSESGSDEYLHYKAFPKSSASTNEQSAFNLDGKINKKPILSSESLPLIDRSMSDEQILSSNISSEALFSQSESEAYPISELSNNSSPVTIDRDRDNFVNLPPGWTQEYDAQSKQICFVNVRGEKWFSSNDAEGKIYFFEENSNESSWLLPTVTITEPIRPNMQEKQQQDVELRSSGGSEKFRIGKARSLVVGNQRISKKERRSGSVTHDWPQLFDGNMCILKEGTLQRAKITENGKRLRKNWNTSYVVLSELFLLFFKDAKSFTAMKSGQSAAAKPDISVDLNGATVQPDEKASSRKNVYMIGTILGLQVLIQSDNFAVANEWCREIQDVINKLPSSVEAQTTLPPPSLERSRDVKSKLYLSVNSPEETTRVTSRIGRSRSIKIKKMDGSTEDLSGSSTERQTKIKAKLKRFFQRRPTMESLVKNGIYKDEPAFGSYLKDVCTRQPPMVPQFVKDCVMILERNPENMKADGLYRASGNLSQIQKIRLQVDQNNLEILEQEEDVHVLTGALKLFFRELKEPLIPCEFFEKALEGSLFKKRSDRIHTFKEIVRGLPQPHYDTLQFLLQHLLKVTMYQEYNRMHIPNLAIVFGPTLMWPKVESANMALDLMQQNLVIECLLSEYDKIFK